MDAQEGSKGRSAYCGILQADSASEIRSLYEKPMVAGDSLDLAITDASCHEGIAGEVGLSSRYRHITFDIRQA